MAELKACLDTAFVALHTLLIHFAFDSPFSIFRQKVKRFFFSLKMENGESKTENGFSQSITMSMLTYPHSLLHDPLRKRAHEEPDRVAIVFENRSLTFADLDIESNRLAHGLRALGLNSGDRLCIFMPNCPEVEIAFY